jgi:hypothetical protein
MAITAAAAANCQAAAGLYSSTLISGDGNSSRDISTSVQVGGIGSTSKSASLMSTRRKPVHLNVVRAVHAAPEPNSTRMPQSAAGSTRVQAVKQLAPEAVPTAAAADQTTSRNREELLLQQPWSPRSWRSKIALQQPTYPSIEELEAVEKTLTNFPPLVFAGEARRLEERLHDAALGKAFLLQGGDCAESFKEFDPNNIRDSFRVLLQMGVVLMFGGQMPVVKVVIPPQLSTLIFFPKSAAT